jgi:hypothetical protein
MVVMSSKLCYSGSLDVSTISIGNNVQHIDQIIRSPAGGSMSYVVGLPNNSYKPITNTAWVPARLCKLQKGCTRLAAASDKV